MKLSSPKLDVPKALLSVTDKTNLVRLAKRLKQHEFEILCTGGTARQLKSNGVITTEISDFTASPEILNGRVKTLHPRVFGEILTRPDTDQEEMVELGLDSISIVVVNLYEFERTIADESSTSVDAMESIDIGGVSLIRAAAKNNTHVLVVVDPHDYDEVMQRVQDDAIDGDFRKRMAAKAFRHTAAYDAAIAGYLTDEERFPEKLTLSYVRDQVLRYGENPHQAAAFYRNQQSAFRFQQLHGKQLSYNNIADVDAAIACVESFTEPCCVIVKHANPCGFATGISLVDTYEKAFRCDPTSAFGGIIACNQMFSKETLARILERQFVEVIAAPGFTEEALRAAKARKSLRLLSYTHPTQNNDALSVKNTAGGLLVQEQDFSASDESDWNVVTCRQPTTDEWRDLRFAWIVVHHVKSNAIVFAHDNATVGIGAGQMNRVLSVRIAALRMQEEQLDASNCVMAADAFFPFRDGIDEAAKAGVTAVIQPGGSVRDEEVIDACNEHDLALVHTGKRHFKH